MRYSDVIPLEVFADMVQNGEITDSDGIGFHGFEITHSDFDTVKPSKFLSRMAEIVAEGSTHIHWYNK